MTAVQNMLRRLWVGNGQRLAEIERRLTTFRSHSENECLVSVFLGVPASFIVRILCRDILCGSLPNITQADRVTVASRLPETANSASVAHPSHFLGTVPEDCLAILCVRLSA